MTPERNEELCLGVECAWPPQTTLRGHAPRHAARTRILCFVIAFSLCAIGGWQFGRGAWILAKAWLGQALIAQAWSRTLAGERHAKPWPWADTWPVARITVPGLGIERYVLAGANGATLAFGPGHMDGTALPGTAGNSVIGGHRDTHLAFLRELPRGAQIVVETMRGEQRRYVMRYTQVLDRRDVWVAKQEGPTRITLVTCYPFDALRAGGPKRYVVSAYAIDKTDSGALSADANRGSGRGKRG